MACSIDGCDRDKVVARGLCSMHYQRRRRSSTPVCSFTGCKSRILARGLCPGHYSQMRKGRGLIPLRPPVVVNVGDKYGLWVVEGDVPRRGSRHRKVLVRCQCGILSVHSIYALVQGMTSGCHRCRAPYGEDSPGWCGIGDMSGAYWGRVLRGAVNRGISVEITKEDVWRVFESQGGKCALSGVPISFGTDQTASLDRKDSKLGYVIGNIQWVHKHVNRMKGSLTDLEFVEWCRTIARYSDRR